MNQKRPDSTEALPTQGARSGLRDLLSIWGPVALLTLAGFVVAWQFVEPAPPRHLVLATGSPDGAYHRFGLRYQDILKRHGIEVELRNTAGSVENLQFLRDKGSEVEAAFLQGGLGPPEAGSGLEGLASLFYEPLWIFQREASDATLTDFAGRRVAIGKPGSGTHAAVQRLIENNELPTTALERLELGGNAAADALLSEQADVACFVASIEAPYIRRLLLSEGIHLASFVRAEAYKRRYRSLASVVLPRGTADLRRDIPPADIEMLAPVASLVVRDSLHPILAVLLVQAAVEVHGQGGVFERQGQFPSTLNMAFPVHEDALRYLERGPPWLQRYLPFWIAVSIDRLLILLIPLATLLIPLFKIAPPTYRWRIRKRIYDHYRYLLQVENALAAEPSPARLDRCAALIEGIEEDLAEVEVPLSYADQLYHLRMHVRYVKQRVDQARLELA